MSEIIHGKLLLGDMFDANNATLLKNHNVTCVICVAKNIVVRPNSDVKIYNYELEDTCDCDISVYFDEISDIIHKEKIVLVNCAAGISRSSTIVIAYIMKYYKLNLKHAFLHVQNRRRQICPNKNFLRCLFDYETKLYGKNGATWDEMVKLCYYS